MFAGENNNDYQKNNLTRLHMIDYFIINGEFEMYLGYLSGCACLSTK